MSEGTFRGFIACRIERALDPTPAVVTRSLMDRLPEDLQDSFVPQSSTTLPSGSSGTPRGSNSGSWEYNLLEISGPFFVSAFPGPRR